MLWSVQAAIRLRRLKKLGGALARMLGDTGTLDVTTGDGEEQV